MNNLLMTESFDKNSSRRLKKILLLLGKKNEDTIIIKARTITDYIRAARFLRVKYLKSGIIGEKESGFIVNKALVNRDSLLFYCKENENVIGTAGVISDRDLGIPCRKLFNDNVNKIISKGLSAVEIGALSSDCPTSDNDLVFNLYFHIFIHCVTTENIDVIFIQVQEKHAKFYINNLMFQLASNPKKHPEYNDIRAVLLQLNLSDFRRSSNKNNLLFLVRLMKKLNLSQKYKETIKSQKNFQSSDLSEDEIRIFHMLCDLD